MSDPPTQYECLDSISAVFRSAIKKRQNLMWTTLELGVQLAMVSCGNIPLLGPFAALHNKSGTEHKKHKKRTQEAQEEQKNLQFEFLLVPFVPLVFRSLNRCAKPPLPRRGISPPFKVARYDQH